VGGIGPPLNGPVVSEPAPFDAESAAKTPASPVVSKEPLIAGVSILEASAPVDAAPAAAPPAGFPAPELVVDPDAIKDPPDEPATRPDEPVPFRFPDLLAGPCSPPLQPNEVPNQSPPTIIPDRRQRRRIGPLSKDVTTKGESWPTLSYCDEH
jgi:hypothetical protein